MIEEWFELLWWNDTYERFEANSPAEEWRYETLEEAQAVVKDAYDSWKKDGERLSPYKIIKVSVIEENLDWFKKND